MKKLIFSLLFILLLSNGSYAKPNWTINYAREKGCDLPAGFTIDFRGFSYVFNKEAGIDIVFDRKEVMPSSNRLTFVGEELYSLTLEDFIDSVFIAWDLGENKCVPNDSMSFLFLIRDINFSGKRRYGVTIPMSYNGCGVSISLVFVEKIKKRTPLKNSHPRKVKDSFAERVGRRIDNTVLHEIGHARGLNYSLTATKYDSNDPYFDHTYHAGDFREECVMHKGFPDDESSKMLHFCSYHRGILRNCLMTVMPSYSQDCYIKYYH